MAEVFGAVVGGITLCSQLANCAIAINKAVKRIKNARRDIVELSDETAIFAGISADFFKTYNNERDTNEGLASSATALEKWVRATLNGLKDVLQKAQALRQDPKNPTSLQDRLIARLEWFFSKGTVKRLRVALTVATLNIVGASNLMCVRRLNEELHILRNALQSVGERRRVEQRLGSTLEEKIRSINLELGIKTAVHRANDRKINAAHEKAIAVHAERSDTDTGQDLIHLLHVTETVADYAQEVLPKARPSHRREKAQGTYTSSRLGSRGGWRAARPNSHSPSSSSISTSTRPSISSSRYTSNDSVPLTDVSSNTDISREFAQNRPSVRAPGSRLTHRAEIQSDNRHHTTKGMRIRTLSNTTSTQQNKKTIKPRMWRIGRHTIILGANFLRVNGHHLQPKDYDIANEFVTAILDHRDKLDELDEALADPNRNDEWTGILGWRISL